MAQPPWTEELVEKTVDLLLEDQGREISIFATTTKSRFDQGHALGVIAGSIGASAFSQSAREEYVAKLRPTPPLSKQSQKHEPKDEFGRKLVALLCETAVFLPGDLKKTPGGNQNFAPSDDFHYDATPEDVRRCARALLDGIHAGSVVCTRLLLPDYRAQAAIALSACIARFGEFTETAVPDGWRNGSALSAAEQIARLVCIAGGSGRQTDVAFFNPSKP